MVPIVVAQIDGSAPRNRYLSVSQRGRIALSRDVARQGGRQSNQQTNGNKQLKRFCAQWQQDKNVRSLTWGR